MNEFKAYHPIVNFIYFSFVIGFSMFFMHPICLSVSLVCGFAYSVILKGKKAVRENLSYMLPVLILGSLVNPAFNHGGVTVIAYLPDGNPLTLEAAVYGLAASVMIVSVICWFSCFGEVMTSDKLIYLLGRIIPSLSLIFSMTLRFVPRFLAQLKLIANAHRCMGKDVTAGNIVRRAKSGLSILSAAVTWALENSIDTADSMKSRGYGLPGRTAYSIYRFDKRDLGALLCIVLLISYTFIGNLAGGMYHSYFPSLRTGDLSVYGITVFFVYFLLCISPIIIECKEAIRWKSARSKI